MLNAMRTISSRQNPAVRTFRDLAAHPPLDGSRLLLDGAHLVREARAARMTFEQVAVALPHVETRGEIAQLARALIEQGVDVAFVTEPVMGAMSPVRTPSGIVAIVARPPVAIAPICQHPAALIVAPVDVQDPGNLGALLRAAEAAGATGSTVCGTSANPFSWKAVRGSMGSVLRLPVSSGATPESLLACAKTFGVRAVASVPRGGTAPDAVDWRGRVLIFVGGEGPGLTDAVINACDERVSIPMDAPVESLNVAVAGALLVYEARRQRKGIGTQFAKSVK
jgi:RNA methyltransferase, TrmH family